MTNRVFVLDMYRNPLMPCHPARARKLIRDGRASIFRRYPFTIIFWDRESGDKQEVRGKIDPGSKTTGMVLTANFAKRGWTVIWAANLHHRSYQIRSALEDRRALRQGRRSRKTRYRKPRFLNRIRPKGWLPPSTYHRVATTKTWALRLAKWTPMGEIELEWTKFDTQLMENPDISGKEYQQGTLAGYEKREYLLTRHGHTCAYCDGQSGDVILNIEHVQPRSRGGSNRTNNLVIACRQCNEAKGNNSASEWARALEGSKRKLDKTRQWNAVRIQKGVRPSMRDAAAMNAVRYRLASELQKVGISVSLWSGGRTKYNRTRQAYPKAHWIDAACIGRSGESVALNPESTSFTIQAIGQGERKRARPDKYGFPRSHKARQKASYGYKTGDVVKIQSGKHKGGGGRCWVRFKQPSFEVETKKGRRSVHSKHLVQVHKLDGYSYK